MLLQSDSIEVLAFHHAHQTPLKERAMPCYP